MSVGRFWGEKSRRAEEQDLRRRSEKKGRAVARDEEKKNDLVQEAFRRLSDFVNGDLAEAIHLGAWSHADLEEMAVQANRIAGALRAAIRTPAPEFDLVIRSVLDENTCATCLAADGRTAPDAEPPSCERVKNGDGICRCTFQGPSPTGWEAWRLRAQVVIKRMEVDPPHLTAVLTVDGKMYSAAAIGERFKEALVSRVVAQALAARRKAGG